MAFQIKNFASVAASIINILKATQTLVTDFNVGAVIRTMVEAVAAEIDELYQQMFIGLKEAIPVSVYNSFDFAALEALPASGLVRVTITSSASDTTIPASTSFSLDNGTANYLSNSDVTIPAGSTFADVLVTADTPGAFANITAGQVFLIAPAVSGLLSATNLAGFSSGTDAETPEDRKSRFRAFIASLPRGTVSALEYGLKLAFLTGSQGEVTERVISSSIVEPWLTDSTQPISLVNCYIHNGAGTTSVALIARAREVIYGYYDVNNVPVPGWKAAGVRVDVFGASEIAVNVAGVLVASDGFDPAVLRATASEAVYSYLLSLAIGQPAIKSEIIAIIMGIDGVFNITLSAPTADTSSNKTAKLMPGTIAIT